MTMDPQLPDIRTMAESLVVTAGQATQHGVAPDDVYKQRLATCFSCEAFIHRSKRCAKCGCFMQAKARVAGDPAILCPMQKWQR